MPQPLAGITVLDFSTLLPGPLATLILAEAGARVIKVEKPGGEEMRAFAPYWGGESAMFALLNRGKESVVADLKSKDDRSRVLELAESADVLVEQFRPGVMERLGLGQAWLCGLNQRLIYCSITGYGQTGPKRHRAGHDINYVGDAGLLSLSFGSAELPVLPPALIADIGGGTYPAVMNILLALRDRESSGRGCHIDIAMTDNVLPFMPLALAYGFAKNRWLGNGEGRLMGASPRYQLYATSDGLMAAVGALEQKFWDTFCDAIELEPSWRDDRRDPAGAIRRIREIIATRSSVHWRQVFDRADCCCTILQDVREAVGDPHVVARGLLEQQLAGEAGARMPALPVPIVPIFRGGASNVRAAPRLAEQTRVTSPPSSPRSAIDHACADDKTVLLALFEAALAAARPQGQFEGRLPQPPQGRTIVVGAGKAAASMARAFEDAWGRPCEGLVVTRYGHNVPTRYVEVVEAAHPVPDEAGQQGRGAYSVPGKVGRPRRSRRVPHFGRGLGVVDTSSTRNNAGDQTGPEQSSAAFWRANRRNERGQEGALGHQGWPPGGSGAAVATCHLPHFGCPGRRSKRYRLGPNGIGRRRPRGRACRLEALRDRDRARHRARHPGKCCSARVLSRP